MAKAPYHHGDLRRAVMAAAATLIAEEGVEAVSLREVARRTGVSHAAPAHHFGDERGLFTAIAAEGHDLLADALAGGPPDAPAPPQGTGRALRRVRRAPSRSLRGHVPARPARRDVA